jgi:propanediol dehydratase large subunit
MNNYTKEKIEGIYSEIEAVRTMKEEEVCLLYKVDSKDEAIRLMKEEIDYINEAIERGYKDSFVNYFV